MKIEPEIQGTAERQRGKPSASQDIAEIAVILPCYNPGAELSWTLDSLRSQTVPFKLFVTDDGSKSKPDYHALLRDFDYHLIELPRNVGVCSVRNTSLRQALEEKFGYIALIDCGDWAHPARLELQLAFLKANRHVSAVGSAVEILNDDMSYRHDYFPPQQPEAIRSSLYYGLTFKHPSMMFRADVFTTIGLYSQDYDAAEDYELVRRVAVEMNLANLPTVLLKKVESVTSVSATRRTAQLLSRLRIQWRYRNLRHPHCWLGLGKTLVVLALPTKWVKRLQPLVYAKRAPRLDTAQGHRDQRLPT